ncbi:MAG: DNA topoisomerase, partial [Candidatus Saccharimonadales bacterium]
AIASAASYIEKTYGQEYVQVRAFKTKSANAQEAHEAIRPTDMSLEIASGDSYDQKLYDLIRRRTLASQMAPAKLEKTEITIDVSAAKQDLVAKGEVIVFPGFLAVYGGGKDDTLLPNIASGDTLDMISAEGRQVFARPPARYTEGSLVKKLEELGIGRPSTYATIINTVQTRGYVERGEGEGEEREVIVLATASGNVQRSIETEKTGSSKGKLVPTPAGELIADFLTDHFDQVVDYGFTASVEKHFDEIATDSLERNKMLKEFYGPFHSLIEKSGDIDRSTVGSMREVGADPKSG